jgi:hypothetical protein
MNYIYLLLFYALLNAPVGAQQAPRDAVRKFVADVTIDPTARLRRWASPPAVSIYNNTSISEVETICNTALDSINTALTSVPFQLSKMAPRSSEAPMRIVICARKDFIDTLKNHGVTPIGARTWGTWKWWDDSHQLTRAVIIISVEQGDENNFSLQLQSALMLALGFKGFSAVPMPSILAQVPEDLSNLPLFDQQLLPFFYQHCQPGFKLYEVLRAFDSQWP